MLQRAFCCMYVLQVKRKGLLFKILSRDYNVASPGHEPENDKHIHTDRLTGSVFTVPLFMVNSV